ncbi:DUF881 domain-containing protein [Krasilnikovia sp. MM14-A1004]|uniref:DUF881 domain-containing protein n=1 Tax=Krasilnikovia sp. MM14-A1004 TaxID=3373541 RepID=UPI00399CEC7F
MSEQHGPRPGERAADPARDDEPTVVTPRDEPTVATPDDEQTVITSRDAQPASAARNAERSGTGQDDPTAVAAGDEPTVVARADVRQVGTADDEPTVATPGGRGAAAPAPIAADVAQPTGLSPEPVVAERAAPDREGPEPSRQSSAEAGAARAGSGDPDGPRTGPEELGPEDAGAGEPGAAESDAGAAASSGAGAGRQLAPWRRVSSAGALIWVLLALFGFTLVVQLRSNGGDEGLATARQEDLVRILSDLEARDTRLQAEINGLEQSQRQLTSGVAGRQAALAEADKRADELGLLAGTLPGRGPGLRITIDPKGQGVKASAILNAVQELRGAGGEVMELTGAGGTTVRIVAGSYFIDSDGGGIVVDGARLTGPYTLSVIGVPQTMQTALQIPGGVVASVEGAGGSVTMEQRAMVEVTAVRRATSLQYARPVS